MEYQMTEKTLNALKGWPNLHAVDIVLELSDALVAAETVVPGGSCGHMNSNRKFALGVGTNSVMPLFLFHPSNDPTVRSRTNLNPATDRGAFVNVNPSGGLLALPAKGAYELASTQYDTTAAGTYVPNAPLTSPTTGGNAGKLVVGTMYTDMIVGIVSRGIIDSGDKMHTAVAFWPVAVFPTA